MTWVLVRKLLRDLRWALVVVALILGVFQCFWAHITARILGQLAPFFATLASFGGLDFKQLEEQVFSGPGQIARTIIGGDAINLQNAMHLMSIGYVHPLMVTLFCVWAIGRATGAIAGELDRGTMELLLAQPIARWRIILAHFLVDLFTIPVLCLSLWLGTAIGTWMVTPIQVQIPKMKQIPPPPRYLYRYDLGPVEIGVKGLGTTSPKPSEKAVEKMKNWLEIRPWEFLSSLLLVGGLMFSITGMTLWMSAAGRSRWRVLGLAVLFVLLQFFVNVLGQLWDVIEPLRPFTVFYYYQPQQIILHNNWCVTFGEWNGNAPLWWVPMPVVLYGVGAFGYLMAWWVFRERDLPAPL